MKKLLIILSIVFISFGNIVYGNGSSSSSTSSLNQDKKDAPAEFKDSSTDLSSPGFEIQTSLFISDYEGIKGGDTKETINNLLGRIIQKMMIVLGSLSFVLMIIGGGILILSGGDDSQLKRGKKTFNYSIIGLIVALSSYYLVNLIGYILYNGK